MYGRDGYRKRRVGLFKAKIYQDKLGKDERIHFLSSTNYVNIRRPGLWDKIKFYGKKILEDI